MWVICRDANELPFNFLPILKVNGVKGNFTNNIHILLSTTQTRLKPCMNYIHIPHSESDVIMSSSGVFSCWVGPGRSCTQVKPDPIPCNQTLSSIAQLLCFCLLDVPHFLCSDIWYVYVCVCVCLEARWTKCVSRPVISSVIF